MVEKKPSCSLRKHDGWTALHDAHLKSIMVMNLIFWDVADKHQQYVGLAVLFYRPHRILTHYFSVATHPCLAALLRVLQILHRVQKTDCTSSF